MVVEEKAMQYAQLGLASVVAFSQWSKILSRIDIGFFPLEISQSISSSFTLSFFPSQVCCVRNFRQKKIRIRHQKAVTPLC